MFRCPRLPAWIRLQREIVCACLLVIASGIAFGIQLPSLEPFVTSSPSATPPGLGRSEQAYSWLVALFSLGEFVGANLAGVINGRVATAVVPLQILNVVGLFGSILFALSNVYALSVVGRILTGIWSGGTNLSIRLIMNGDPSIKAHLTFWMALVAAMASLAMMLSPGLGGAMAGFQPTSTAGGFLKWDEYRAPAWTIAFVILACIPIVAYCLRPTASAAHEPLLLTSQDVESGRNEIKTTSSANFESSAPTPAPSRYWNRGDVPLSVVVTLLFCFGLFSFSFTVIESLATPIMQDHFGSNGQGSGMMYVSSGVVGVVTFVSLMIADKTKLISDAQAMVLSQVLVLVGAIVLMDFQALRQDPCAQFSCGWSEDSCPTGSAEFLRNQCETATSALCAWNQADCPDCPPVCRSASRTLSSFQLQTGLVLFNVQFILGRIVCASLYSKLLPGDDKKFMQSILLSVGTASRVAGPLAAIQLYEVVQHRTLLVMIVVAAMALVGLIATGCIFMYLRAREVTWNEKEQIDNGKSDQSDESATYQAESR